LELQNRAVILDEWVGSQRLGALPDSARPGGSK